jgi:metal-dependent amidase/aminoacylase/carboxypeptidase family protein
VNVIPERAACQFNVRALDDAYLEVVSDMVVRCARGAALASGTEVTVRRQRGYRAMRDNMALARCFGAHLAALGRPAPEGDPDAGLGSTDMGDVSHAVPSIHPYLAICDRNAALCHQHAFAAHAASERGLSTMRTASLAIARTAADLLADDVLRAAVRSEFEGRTLVF